MLKWETLPFFYKVSRAAAAFGTITVFGALIYAGVYKIVPSLLLIGFGMVCCMLFGIALSITPEDKAMLEKMEAELVAVLNKFKGVEETARALATERDDVLKQVENQKASLLDAWKEVDILSKTLEELRAKPAPKTAPPASSSPEAEKLLPKTEPVKSSVPKTEPEIINRKGSAPSVPPVA